MASQSAGTRADTEPHAGLVPWASFANRTAAAFTTGGLLLVASVLVPIGLGAVTEWAWASGLVLVGLGVVAVAAGLLGTYPRVSDRAPWLGRTGALSATIAGGTALGLTAAVAAAVTAAVAFGVSLPKPMGAFRATALAMAGGLALGFVLFGVARTRSDGRSERAGSLLIAGGALLLVPVVGELLRIGVGVGPPSWLVFPALGAVTVVALTVGRTL